MNSVRSSYAASPSIVACLSALLLMVPFASCDCIQSVTGVVVDEDSHQPVQNVAYERYPQRSSRPDQRMVWMTDTNGTFIYDGISGGLFGCPNVTLSFSKEGYVTKQVSYQSMSEGDTVVLQKKR